MLHVKQNDLNVLFLRKNLASLFVCYIKLVPLVFYNMQYFIKNYVNIISLEMFIFKTSWNIYHSLIFVHTVNHFIKFIELARLLTSKFDEDNVTCIDYYKVYWVYKKQELKAITTTTKFSLFACKPTLDNLFCGTFDHSATVQWNYVRPCTVINGTELIACPIFKEKFRSFNSFANWMNKSFIYKISGTDHVTGKVFENAGQVITPSYRCPKIGLIHPGNSMFN